MTVLSHDGCLDSKWLQQCRRHMQQKLVPATGNRNCYQKLASKTWRKFITVSCTKTTLRPITLHGSCHVPDSFCDGIELCSIPYQKLVPEKLVPDWLTGDIRASFWYQTTGTRFWCVCRQHYELRSMTCKPGCLQSTPCIAVQVTALQQIISWILCSSGWLFTWMRHLNIQIPHLQKHFSPALWQITAHQPGCKDTSSLWAQRCCLACRCLQCGCNKFDQFSKYGKIAS